MSILELRDKRNKLLHDAQAILLASPDAEKRSQAQRMLADADTLEADITALERIERIQGEERSRTAPPRSNPNGGVETASEQRTANERRAFSDYIRYGRVDNSNLQEHRDLTTGTAGQLVPQSFYPVLTETQKSYGYILAVVNNVETNDGAPQKYAVVDDTANGLVVLGEDTAASETDPAISGGIISTDFCSTGIVTVSLAQLQDSAFDIDAWLRNSMGKRYYRGLAADVTKGNGSNIAGLVSSVSAGVTSAAPTAIAWADIAALYAALDPAYEANAVFSMSTSTRGALLATTDSLGRPLYIPAPNAQAFDQMLGKRVVINPFMDGVAATKVPVLYGDHSAYILRSVRPGLAIVRLNERFMEKGMVGFIGFSRNGGALLQGSVAPIVKLTQHA